MSQMIKTSFIVTFAAMIASALLAQTPAPDATAMAPKAEQAQKSVFQKMDRNNDGKATVEEHQARLKEWFKEMDKNGDGKLTPDEYSALHFVEADINKDGTITVEEYLVFFVGKDALAMADATAASDSLYPKGAKEITGAEVIAYRKSVFKAIDANGDGKVTSDEMNTYDNKEFGFLDKNKDGLVTEEEITAFVVIPVCADKAADTKPAAPAEK